MGKQFTLYSPEAYFERCIQAYSAQAKPWKNLKASLTTESNDLPAKLTLPTYPRSSLLINLMLIFLFNQHIFSAYRFTLTMFLFKL